MGLAIGELLSIQNTLVCCQRFVFFTSQVLSSLGYHVVTFDYRGEFSFKSMSEHIPTLPDCIWWSGLLWESQSKSFSLLLLCCNLWWWRLCWGLGKAVVGLFWCKPWVVGFLMKLLLWIPGGPPGKGNWHWNPQHYAENSIFSLLLTQIFSAAGH
jgi:hypothetical protein